MIALNWTDIIDGAIANAAWGVTSMVAKPRTGRQVAAALDTAAWADTEGLIREVLAEIAAAELPELSADEATELETAIRTPEVQGALQALLAVRLTDAPETDAARAREAVRLALTESALPPPRPGERRRKPTVSAASAMAPLPAFEAAGRKYAAVLSEYFDDRVSALVATLEGRVGFAGLAQVRAEAYNARIVGLLGSIERQVTALADPARGTRAEAEFLERYRRQAHQRHGFLTPPDFDRRRRVLVADIYVPTGITEEDDTERMRLVPGTEPGSLNVRELEGLLNRTVLLGDPGGGKTTAANVLTDRFAADDSPRVAFFVTLREYAAKAPIEWSVAEHIEHNLSTLYQSPAPDGLVERLLVTGRAVVIFDGLDELLDTSRRRDVSERVEQFCSAYALAPVLVTSRAVGYDQARLDDTQFTCYRLGGFGNEEVTEYAGKWFRTQEGLAPAEAEAKAKAFIEESARAADLRGNPLLMSLMCILYRGAGSLPGDRAGIYARCAELLLRKWDEQRDLYRKLGTDHLVEPTLRYLAWWLFTRENSQTAATERELTAKAAEFLYERGYETEEEAAAASREFVEFCRGRMWVFSDAGTTADGEKLYGFTHRTFMEYFAAGYLAVTSESPEDLARALAPRIAAGEWGTVAELAIRIKSDMSDRGADRVYVTLLDPAQAPADGASLLEFLAECLPSAHPAPSTSRLLARAALDYATGRGEPVQYGLSPLFSLLGQGNFIYPVAEEIGARVAALIASDDASVQAEGVRLLASVRPGVSEGYLLPGAEEAIRRWQEWLDEQGRIHAIAINSVAQNDQDIRVLAANTGVLAPEAALAMPGGLTTLATIQPVISESPSHWIHHPYATQLAFSLCKEELTSWAVMGADAIGRFLLCHETPPWVHARSTDPAGSGFVFEGGVLVPALDEVGSLGVAAVLCLLWENLLRREVADVPAFSVVPDETQLDPLLRYLNRRLGSNDSALPDLAVPSGFRQLFRDWAERRVNFIGVMAG